MIYKSLLTVLTDPDWVETPLAQIVELAEANDAHAYALCIGVDRSPHGYYEAGGNALLLQQALDQAQEEASVLVSKAEALLAPSGIRWATERGVSALAGMGEHVANRSRFSDLVVMPLPFGKGKGSDMEVAVEAALFGGRAPVLVMPDDAKPVSDFKTVIVAWNEGVEAMAAVRKSLPILRAADLVRIVTVGPATHRTDQTDPGGMLSQMLARHGVTCEVEVLGKTLPRTSDVLNRHVTDTGADMLVMGAYGHSRLREAILSGTTRNMLENATVPVLMAH
ncbi:MAG: universal stress protein [Paracoccaceae bacterium]